MAQQPDVRAAVPAGQFFRAGVGIAVLNDARHVLALERYGMRGAWQLPQGGLEIGEEPVDAAPRELREETGLDWQQVELLSEYPGWLAYELDAADRKPDIGRGQTQKWFVVRLSDPAAEITLEAVDARKGDPEFAAYEWISPADLLARAAPFRRAVYKPLVAHIQSLRT